MKRILKLLLFIPLLSYSQEYIESSKWTRFMVSEEFGKEVKRIDSVFIQEFDLDSNIITKISYKYDDYGRENGYKYMFNYDVNGNLISTISYNSWSSHDSERQSMYVLIDSQKISSMRTFKYVYRNEKYLIKEIIDFKQNEYTYSRRSSSRNKSNLKLESKSIYEYDNHNNKTSLTLYNSSGSIETKYSWVYDRRGNNIEYLKYSSDGDLEFKNIYEYQNKHKVKMIRYSSSGSLVYRYNYQYDNNGNMIKKYFYESDRRIYKIIYKYDSKDNLIGREKYNSEGDLEYRYVSRYDSRNNRIAYTYYRKDVDEPAFQWNYRYDDNDNMIELISSSDFKYVFKYNFDDNLIERKKLVYEFKFGERQEILEEQIVVDYGYHIKNDDTEDTGSDAPESDEINEEDVYDSVEQMPLFRGCDHKECTYTEIMKFISMNFKYPEISKSYGVEGRVILDFVVEKDGSVGRIRILRGVDQHIDKAAIDVVKSLPKFIPGHQSGVTVPVRYTVPIKCTLQ